MAVAHKKKKVKHKIPQIIRNFAYDGVEAEYNYTTACDERGCEAAYENGGGYCRCGQYEDISITKVDMPVIRDVMTKHLSEFKAYCVDRVLVYNHVYNPDSWEMRVRPGYYGEESVGIYLLNGEECQKQIDTVIKLRSHRQRLEYVLTLEYGFVLDDVRNQDWTIKTVPLKSLIFGQKNYHCKIGSDVVDEYRKCPNTLPKAVCLRADDKYRIIDGYHRCQAWQEEQIKIICDK